MPSRLRDQYMRQVLEALIRYGAAGHELTYQSERMDDTLSITFTLADADTFHETLSEVSRTDEPGDD